MDTVYVDASWKDRQNPRILGVGIVWDKFCLSIPIRSTKKGNHEREAYELANTIINKPCQYYVDYQHTGIRDFNTVTWKRRNSCFGLWLAHILAGRARRTGTLTYGDWKVKLTTKNLDHPCYMSKQYYLQLGNDPVRQNLMDIWGRWKEDIINMEIEDVFREWERHDHNSKQTKPNHW